MPSTIVLRGPCVIKRGALAIYTKADVGVVPDVKSVDIESDAGGAHTRKIYAGHLWNIDFTPVGELEDAALYWPWSPLHIGASIFGASPTAVTVQSMVNGDIVSLPRSGISQPPPLILSSRKTCWGNMRISALGEATRSNDDYEDAGFDPDKIKTAQYRAALGDRDAPYDALTARDGFTCTPGIAVDEVPDDEAGVADLTIADIFATVAFAPGNLTSDQYHGLLPLGDDEAMIVGQDFSSADEDLVISGAPATFTLHKAGVEKIEQKYGVKVDRNGQVMFSNRLTTTTGVRQPRWTLAIT